jgi:uncharacterized repeat protein (TIGR02543 family)
LTFDGQTVFSTTANFTSWPSSKSVSGSKSVTKTHSAQSKTLAFHGASTAISVPAKASYAVSFNANSGSAAPSQQTKWYNETLTISSSKPTKDGYTFMGWATSVANASAGTVNYASGASYSVNAALSLYAVWELAYAKPTISSVSIERCNQNGDADDDGTYAKVSFKWSVYTSSASQYYGGSDSPYASNAPVCTVRVDSDEVTPTLTTSPTEPIIIGNGSYDTDTEYNVTITLSDTQTIKSDKSTTESGKLTTAKFPMDFNRDGTAVGLLCTAPDNTNGIYLGDDVHIYGNVDLESGAEYRINGKSITSQPIKVEQYEWVASPAKNERTLLIPNANPSNSSNSGSEPSSSEYTFFCWVQFKTTGWVGSIYSAQPLQRTTNVWTASSKAATTGVSVIGVALYVRNDLL